MKLVSGNRRYLYLAAAVLVAAVLIFVALGKKEQASPIAGFSQPEVGDVAGYMRDCVAGVLKGGAVPATCSSAAAARKAYGVDIMVLLEAEHARAVSTAQYIATGQILDEDAFRACVKEGDCVPLPLPRSVSDPDRQEKIFRSIQKLAEGGEMNMQTCAILDICRALVKAGLYDPRGEGGG